MVRLGVLALVLVATLSSSAAADNTPLLLRGVVGPDFTITLITATGQEVSHLDAGTYSVHVDDMSDFHNFHLKGPGVDLTTSVTDIDSYDWTAKFVDGTYTYVCDVHAATMKGSFTVGTVTTTPPPPVGPTVLKGSVGPGAKIALARSAPVGTAKVTIRDLSAKDNFHLIGLGVNKKTGVKFKGTVTWTVFLKAGAYAFRSDAHPKLHGTIVVA